MIWGELMFGAARSEAQRVGRLLEGFAVAKDLQPDEDLLPLVPASGTISKLLRQAGLSRTNLAHLVARQAGVCVLLIAAVAAFGNGWWLIGVPASLLIELGLVKRAVIVRAQAFERDYTALLVSLASAVRTGSDPMQALVAARGLFPSGSVVRGELQRLHAALEGGAGEESAIGSFAASVAHPDVQLFRTAFILARREGSSLAGCLQRLTRVTRQRQSFRRKIRAAVALQKLSALGIAGCAIFIAGIQWVSNPAAVQSALADPMGVKLLSLGALLVVIGLIWMLNMSKTRI